MGLCDDCSHILSRFDLFGKEPEFYFKGKPKRGSIIGLILSIILIAFYITVFIHRLVRMFNRVDVTFYDTYAFTGTPSIHLTNENFYGGFGIGYSIDETIYYPKAYFYSGRKIDDIWEWEKYEIGVGRCDLENFGSNYKEIFKDKKVDSLYCLKDVNFTLEGYANLDVYSYIYVTFHPCVNQTKDGRFCKSREEIEKFLQRNIIEFKMQDIELSPEFYKSPSKATVKDINSPVFKDLYQQIYSYLQIVILETDDDILGFDWIYKTNYQKYVKYDESWLIAAPPNKNDILVTGEPFCDVTVQLSAKVLTQKRKYTKLVDVLGDIGGLMEVIGSVFSIIIKFIADILYEKDLVNNLFSFDLDRKEILIKNICKMKSVGFSKEKQKFNSNNNNAENEQSKTYVFTNKKSDINILKKDTIKNFNNDEANFINRNINMVKKNKTLNININKSSENLVKAENRKENRRNVYGQLNESKNTKNKKILNNSPINNQKETSEEIKDGKRKQVLSNINLNNFCIYLCFFCVRRRKTLSNLLLDEGMNIISENLDIINLFKKVYKKGKEEKENREMIIIMSNECKKNLNLYNNETGP